MAEISLNLQDIRKTKTVKIGDDIYTVRRLGAGEEMKLSVGWTKTRKILEKLKSVDLTKFDLRTKEGRAGLTEVQKELDKHANELKKIKEIELTLFKACFDDGADGEKTNNLIDSLSDEERNELYKRIFDIRDNTVVETEMAETQNES